MSNFSKRLFDCVSFARIFSIMEFRILLPDRRSFGICRNWFVKHDTVRPLISPSENVVLVVPSSSKPKQ